MAQYQSATARSVGDVEAMDNLAQERRHLDSLIENINLPGMQEYRNYYRDEYVPRFQEGASRDVGRYDRFGYDKNLVKSEDVPGEFFKPNNISEARQFNRLYGNDPQVRQQMTDYALDDLRRAAVDPNTNMIREGAVNRWLMKNERILNEMPWVREAVAGRNVDAQYGQLRDIGQQQKLAGNPKTLGQVDPDVGPLQERSSQIETGQKLASNPKTVGRLDPAINDLQARFGQLEQRQRAVGDSKLAGLLGQTPEKQLQAGLNDWQIMRSMKRSVAKDPAADAALTRAVMNQAPDPMDAKAFGTWLDGHDRVLRQVLSPEHMAAPQGRAQGVRSPGSASPPPRNGRAAQEHAGAGGGDHRHPDQVPPPAVPVGRPRAGRQGVHRVRHRNPHGRQFHGAGDGRHLARSPVQPGSGQDPLDGGQEWRGDRNADQEAAQLPPERRNLGRTAAEMTIVPDVVNCDNWGHQRRQTWHSSEA